MLDFVGDHVDRGFHIEEGGLHQDEEGNWRLAVPEMMTPLWTDRFSYEHFALFGGRGGAKSHGIAEPIIYHCGQREERVVCGREYQNSIDDSVKPLLEQKIRKLNQEHLWHITDRSLQHKTTGSKITFLGMNRNPESAKSLEGCTIFWGEEAQTFSKRSIEVIIPTIRSPNSCMMWSWNPRYRTDEVDAMFRGPVAPEKSYIRHVGWRDNLFFYQTRMPSEFRRSRRSNPKRHSHVWEGGYDENPDTAIFQNWEVGRVPIPAKCVPRFGMDFGFGSDPYFAVKLYVIDELDTIFIAQEAHGHQVSNKDIPALMDQITEIRDYEIIGDSSRPETIDYLASSGFPIFGSIKGAGSVKAGINFLAGYKIVIAPECKRMIEEVRSYKWAVDKNDRPMPMPDKGQQDHGIDACRYAVEDLTRSAAESDGGVEYL